ncbi:hypothetical protein BDC45DRAFT_577209 [Circinella umbellata]|nr:hypothetical protein BDC45DRAFT_577209 [Circinella umbellata]
MNIEQILDKKDYKTCNEAYDVLQEYALQQGFAVAKTGGNDHFCKFKCVHGGPGPRRVHRKKVDNKKDDDSNKKGGIISNDGNEEKKIKDKNGILKKISERKTREGEHNCEWVLRISKRKTRWAFTTKLSDITPHSHPMSSTPIIYREHRVVYGQECRKLTNQLKAGIKPRQIINVQSMDEPPVVVAPISVVESISSATMSSNTLPPATPLLASTYFTPVEFEIISE